MQSQQSHWNHQKSNNTVHRWGDVPGSQLWTDQCHHIFFTCAEARKKSCSICAKMSSNISPNIRTKMCRKQHKNTKECIMLILRQYNMLAISISLQSGTAVGADQQGKEGCASHSVTFHLLMREDRLIPWVLPVRILVCVYVDTVTINAPHLPLRQNWD